MSRVHLRVRCPVRETERVGAELTALGWGTLWIDEPLAQHTDEQGYVLDVPPPDAPAVVHAYPTREGSAPRAPGKVRGYAVERVEDAPDETDWSVAWRGAHSGRIPLEDGWVLVAPWEKEKLAQGERAIVIEPGGAFGTGAHVTTCDSLRALHAHLWPGARVLDLGTGSGVLAIAAVLWGAGEVVAVDCQHDAAEHVEGNAARNGIAPGRIRVVIADLIDVPGYGAGGEWDVVLCNVGAAEVLRAMPVVAKALAPAGVLVASGVFAPSRSKVEARATELGLRVMGAWSDSEWVTLAMGEGTGGRSGG